MLAKNVLSPDLIQAMPKIELHIHLEGTIAPATLLRLAAQNKVALSVNDEAGMAAFYRYHDFMGFLEVFGACVECLQTPDDIYMITRELGADSRRQNILYREVFFSPQHYVCAELPYEAVLDALETARAEALRDGGIELNFILDISRQDGDEEAEEAVDRAIAGLGRGVVGLGIGGDEANFPPELFAAVFARARAAGLRLNAHAGEAAGPASIAAALDHLAVERIGHGVRITEEPTLVARVLAEGICLEMCPTSNELTGVIARYEDHPLPDLLAQGLKVTVNSDDPPMFNTDLTNEYQRLADVFGLGSQAMRRLNLNAIEASFLPAAQKSALQARFASAWAETVAGDLGLAGAR